MPNAINNFKDVSKSVKKRKNSNKQKAQGVPNSNVAAYSKHPGKEETKTALG